MGSIAHIREGRSVPTTKLRTSEMSTTRRVILKKASRTICEFEYIASTGNYITSKTKKPPSQLNIFPIRKENYHACAFMQRSIVHKYEA